MRPVPHSAELRRVLALPRRTWSADEAREMASMLTAELRTPTGTMSLWPTQAIALAEIALQRGAFIPVGVGLGKTLISLLAAVVVDAVRPLLLVPAALRDVTVEHVIPALRAHWRLPEALQIRSYAALSVLSGATLLDDLAPDLVIFDEAHALKARTSARTRRLARYLRAHRDVVVVVAMSGTITQRSIMDYWHLLAWCLGGDRMPLPARYVDVVQWAAAIDERHPEPMAPGALSELGTPVRSGYRRRLDETPGVVMSSSGALGTSLRLRAMPVTPSAAVRDLLDGVRRDWTDPQGDPLMLAVDVWRVTRQVALGFWYRWNPAPPTAWREARSAWRTFVRETLAHSRTIDSELQLWRRCLDDDGPAEFRCWRDTKTSFIPHVEAVWVDDDVVDVCAKWLRDDDGIAWVEHIAFGERLAERAGVPYFGADDNRIVDHHGSCVASIRAHGTGKNLQRWSRNLVTSPPTSGQTWEQLLGRTHRHGQTADEVTCDVVVACPESLHAVQQARDDAAYLEQTLGDRQRLLYCDFDPQFRGPSNALFGAEV